MGDNLFPDSVKDFVFDLHDASRRSLIPSEQQGLYSGTFREVTAKVRRSRSKCWAAGLASTRFACPVVAQPAPPT